MDVMWKAVRAMISLRNPDTISGVRNAAFDQGVIAALTTIDTLGLMPPLPDSVAVPSGGLDLRIDVAPREHASIQHAADRAADTTAGIVPLMRMTAPVYRSATQVRSKPGGPFPRYPRDMRERGITDSLVLQFVVTAAGRADLSTLQVVTGKGPFIRAVLDVLPRIEFYPMEMVRGCPCERWSGCPSCSLSHTTSSGAAERCRDRVLRERRQ